MILPVATTTIRMGRAPAAANQPGINGCGGCGVEGLGEDVSQYTLPGEFGGATVPGQPATGVSWWERLLGAGTRTFESRYSTPQIPPGTAIQTAGGMLTRQAPGFPISYGKVTAEVSSGGWVLMAAAAVGLVLLMMARKS